MKKDKVIEKINAIKHDGIRKLLNKIFNDINLSKVFLKDLYIYNRLTDSNKEYAIWYDLVIYDQDEEQGQDAGHYWCHGFLLPTARAIKAINTYVNEKYL
jgi:hypothetical protein